MTKNKRREIYVDHIFQNKFIVQFCGFIFLSVLVLSAILLFQVKDTTITAFVDSRLVIVDSSDFLIDALVGFGLIGVLIVAFGGLLVAVTFSHKIAGPLVNILRNIHQAANGSFNRSIKLRNQDEMVSLAEGLNDMFTETYGRIKRLKELSSELDVQIAQLHNLSIDADKLVEIKQVKNRLDATLAEFVDE